MGAQIEAVRGHSACERVGGALTRPTHSQGARLKTYLIERAAEAGDGAVKATAGAAVDRPLQRERGALDARTGAARFR